MSTMKRSNRSKPRGTRDNQPWFVANVKRWRKRNKIAAKSRRKNR